MKTYNSVYTYNFVCVSETFLNSSFESNDKDLMIEGYNLIQSDHPSNTKRGGVCIYYKESLAVRIVNITSLIECLVCEVTIQNKKGYVAVVYRSPSQSTSEFESFLSGLEDLLSNTPCSKSQFTVILGDFNASSQAWWSEDITTLHGTQIDSLTITNGFKQIISDPTHILPQSSSCHHQTMMLLKKVTELVNWNFLFSNKSVHEQVTIFNQTLMNIFSDYIPNKLITVDDKDPPWMDESSKKKIMAKKYACKSFNTNKNNYYAYLKLQTVSTELSEMILKRKEDYYRLLSDKLNDPHTSTKSYWYILKTLYNGKRIPLIPPTLINSKPFQCILCIPMYTSLKQ